MDILSSGGGAFFGELCEWAAERGAHLAVGHDSPATRLRDATARQGTPGPPHVKLYRLKDFGNQNRPKAKGNWRNLSAGVFSARVTYWTRTPGSIRCESATPVMKQTGATPARIRFLFIVFQTALFSPLYLVQNHLCRSRSPMAFLCLDK